MIKTLAHRLFGILCIDSNSIFGWYWVAANDDGGFYVTGVSTATIFNV